MQAQSYRQWALDQGIGHETSGSDFDHDGLTNFLEYALGSPSKQFNHPSSAATSDYITYPKGQAAKAAGNVTWNIEISETMESGSWAPAILGKDYEENENSLRVSLSAGASSIKSKKKFSRLKVSRTTHPKAMEYSVLTGLMGAPLGEVSHLLYDLEDTGISADFLLLTGTRYQARKGSQIHAIIGGTGTVYGTIGNLTKAMVFDGSASWIEFNNPAQNKALSNYTMFAIASADVTANESLIASSIGGANSRGARLMFNGSSAWGARPGQLSGDVNTGTASSTSGWATLTRIHAGGQLLPVSSTFSAQTVLPAGDLPLPAPSRRVTVSAGVTRSSAAFWPLESTIWNRSTKFRIGANLNGGAYHQGEIAMVLVTRSPAFEESIYQRLATAAVRTNIVSKYGPEVFAVFDGDSVTEGAGSPNADYGTYSWPAQLFGGLPGNHAGGQWAGKFNGRNIAVGGRAISSNEAAWEHTTRHILSRSEWGQRYYFGMVSHNQRDMGSETSLARLEALWTKAKQLGVQPVCVGLLSGQAGVPGYNAVKERAFANNVPFVDTASISQLGQGAFPSGADFFYLDVIHPTEKGYRLIAQEVAARLALPGSPAPRSIQRPAVNGQPLIGSIFSCDSGLWENSPSQITFQWMRNGTDILGATNPFFSITAADLGSKISCRVTAKNAFGAAERTTSHTSAVLAP